MSEPTLLTIENAAERLACSDDQIRKLIKADELTAVNIGSGQQRRCIRVAGDSLRAFIKRRTIQTPAPRRKPLPKPKKEWV